MAEGARPARAERGAGSRQAGDIRGNRREADRGVPVTEPGDLAAERPQESRLTE